MYGRADQSFGRGGEELAFSNRFNDERAFLGRSSRYGVIDGVPIHADKIDVFCIFLCSVGTKHRLQYRSVDVYDRRLNPAFPSTFLESL